MLPSKFRVYLRQHICFCNVSIVSPYNRFSHVFLGPQFLATQVQ